MINHYSRHLINSDNCFPFSADDYSRFKFGDGQIAAQFGHSLAQGFITENLSKETDPKQLVVISSPYSFIPTASSALMRHFHYGLNRWLVSNGWPVAESAKVHRYVTYKEDYGALDASERIQLIGNDRFHIDASFLVGKTLIFLDDIRITGSHERMIHRMAEQYQLQNDIWMLYFAELVNANIHPRIENFLNYYFVKSVFDIDKIIENGAFEFNTRVVKYILNAERTEFSIFIAKQSQEFVHLLFDMALGNGYHLMDTYKTNLNYLENIFIKPKFNSHFITHGD
jgi:hypothetical protein